MNCRSESTKIFSLRLLCSLTVTLLIAALLVAFHPVSSSAQVEWTPEAQVNWDDVYDDRLPRIAAGPDCRIWIVWRGFDGYDWEAFSSLWDGEAWSYPARVNHENFAEDRYPDVAVAPDGVAWVVWTRVVEGNAKLYYTRWDSIEWEPEARVFPDLEDEPDTDSPAIAVDSEGTAWLIWSWWLPDQRVNELFYSRWSDGSWSDAQPVEDEHGPGDVGGRNIAIGENGEVWVMWVRSLGSPTWESVSLYTHWEEDGWAPADTFPLSDIATALAVGVDSDVWVAWPEGGDVYASHYSEGEWAEQEKITAPDSTWAGQNASDADVHISVAPTGSPWVAWVGRNWGYGDFDQEIYASVCVADQWQPESQVSITDGFHDDRVDIDVDALGRAWVVWRGYDGRDYEILSSHTIGAGTMSQEGPHAAYYSILWLPNPVRGGDRARLQVPETPHGPVLVHDLLGRLVARIGTSGPNTGDGSDAPITCWWDSRDVSGRLVLPGTYVSHFSAGGMNYQRRIVVIR